MGFGGQSWSPHRPPSDNVKVCDGFQKQLAYGTAVNDSWGRAQGTIFVCSTAQRLRTLFER